MSALPHFKAQSSSVETFSNAIDAIASDEWPVFQYLGIIHNLEIEGQDLLKNEANKSRVEGASWTPRKGSILKKQIAEALDKNAPKGSLYRRACIEGNSIYPALIIALICNARNNGTLKARSKKLKLKQALEEGIEDAAEKEVVEDVDKDDGKLKSKLTLEEELKVWPTVFFKVLVKRLMMITAPTIRIQIWRDFQDEEIKKREGEGGSEDGEEDEDGSILVLKHLIGKLMKIFENENELHSRKRQRIESPPYRNPPSTNREPPDLAQTSMVAGGSHIQDNPTPQAQSNPHDGAQRSPAAVSQFKKDQPTFGAQRGIPKSFSMKKATFCRLFPECIDHKEFYVNRLGLQLDAPLRVDIGLGPNVGTQVLGILHGEQPTDLAKMSLEQFCNSILWETDTDEMNIVNCSGTGKVVAWIPGCASTLNFELQTARKLWARACGRQ